MAYQSKVIVITGVTGGLGNAMAREFLAFGHKVAGCGRRSSNIDQLNSEFNSIADRCHFAVVNVAEDATVKVWARTVIEKFGPPDYLINNAAIASSYPQKLIEKTAVDFDKVIDVNVKGVANVTRHFVPSMIEAKRGVIVNVTSYAGRSPYPNFGAYATSKWALEGFSRTLAVELPESLMSFQVDPGLVKTAMTVPIMDPDFLSEYITPEEWAKAVCPGLLTRDRSMNGKIWDTTDLGLKNAYYLSEKGKMLPSYRTQSSNAC